MPNERKTLKDYLEEGGIRGKFFKDSSCDKIYLVHRLDDPHPEHEALPSLALARVLERSRLWVTVTYLETNIDCSMVMMPHFYDFEATPEERKIAQRSGLTKALARKTPSSIGEGLKESFSIDPYQI